MARPAAAAHCAAAPKDSNPAPVKLITSTPSTNAVGCRRAPPRRGSGTLRSAASRSPAPPEGPTPGRDTAEEDDDTGTAPADDDWLDTVIISGAVPAPTEHRKHGGSPTLQSHRSQRPQSSDVTEPWGGVHREYRGHGYGKAITIAAAAALQELGSSSAIVCTPSANIGAVATYKSADFQQLPERRDRYRDA